jgi:outer membrane biosynthesis protein TonB
MAGTGEKTDSLRLNRFETKRLVWALVLSLLAHFLVWGGYELGKKAGLWQRLHWPEKLHLAAKKNPPPIVQESEPTMFLDVDPDQVSPDAPKDAKYYSAKNSRAANPESEKDSNQPKLTGKQPDVPKVRDVPRTPATKPRPAPEPPSLQKEQPTPPPKPVEQPGEMKLAKLDVSPEKKETPETPEKPRTLKEARAQQQNLRPSMTMQQDGGTQRRALLPSFDSKSTAFGEYDAKIVEAISQRWYDLLDSQKFAQDRSGKVTLRFHLNYNGTITDMTVLQNTVGDLLGYVCQEAVTGPSPFEVWPSDMRRQIGANFREITFTFYYY